MYDQDDNYLMKSYVGVKNNRIIHPIKLINEQFNLTMDYFLIITHRGELITISPPSYI